ncbi:MAG: 23S rRNA (guanosine(2251)-2'-O)-methyltransferase RlmB [Mogibacterium sp.]|nr:23S rRNA (guanosine(2251)-2'-O)-methyltransferase RlmB [Mogibacterium sp.]
MSKKDNKRFKDSERNTAPKRGGKNRRDYGENYEPSHRSSGARRTSSRTSAAPKSQTAAAGGRGRRASVAPRKADSRRVLGFDIGEQQEANIGTDGLEVIAGRNPVTEALTGEREVERVFIADGAEGSVSKIVAIAKEQGVIVDFVPKEKIDAMAPGAKHQGVVAKVSEYRYADLEEVFDKAAASGEDPFIVMLDEVTDPHNLGAVIRTAECAGAHGVIIPKRRAASLTQTVALAAAGAIESIPVVQVTNLARTIDELKERGVWVGAADMDGQTYYEANLTGPIAIVIGNEGKGVGRLVKEKCDFVLSIPMYGRINSLNASNAAAVLMYGIRRARG